MMNQTLNRWLWGALGYTALFLIAPYYGLRMLLNEKYRIGLRQRFSLYRGDEVERMKEGKCVWFHTVSVGELQAARPLIRTVKERFPQYRTWITTVTESGQNLAESLDEVDGCCYLPLDIPVLCRRFVHRLSPVCLIIFETELWPNLIHTTRRYDVPIFMVNGRLSDKSLGNYQKAKALFAPVLSCFQTIMVQSGQDQERFQTVGAKLHQIVDTGNLKFEAAKPQSDGGISSDWRNLLGIKDNDLLLVAGSTFPGEELLLIQLTTSIRQQGMPLKLVVAPRHIERIPAIGNELKRHQFAYTLRSTLPAKKPSNIILLDTIGELKTVYAAADMVFIGKSLLEKGGQNPLEPASWSKPIVFGPNMQNFRDIAAMLIQAGSAVQIQDAEELKAVLIDWCQNQETRESIGKNALRVLTENQGALERIMRVITPTLEKHIAG